MVTVNLDVKMLKGQYTHSLTNNYTDLSFNLWSEDLQPSETFLRIVRETQIEPNLYYLDTIMNQSLVNNFAKNCHQTKVTVIEQNAPQDDETYKQRQSPCSSNWNDYLHVANDTDNESTDQTEPPTNPNQPTMSTGMWVPQDTCAYANTVVRSVPQALTIQKQKGNSKHSITVAMPIVEVGNANQLWEQIPSLLKPDHHMQLGHW